jgi:hypothetical protein
MAAFVTLFWFVRIWRNAGGDASSWLRFVLAISIAVAGIAVVEYLTKSYVEIDTIYQRLTGIALDDSTFRRAALSFRAISTAGNPLMLGMFCSIAACIALGLYLRGFKIYYLLAFFVNAAATVATMSRSSWAGLLIGSIIVALQRMLKSGRVSHRAYLHYVAALIVACVLLVNGSFWMAASRVSADVMELASDRLVDFSENISFTHRLNSPVAAVSDMLMNPLSLLVGYGIGAENYFFFSNVGVVLSGNVAEDAKTLRTFDNTFMTVLYSFGLVGFGWLLTLIVRAFRANDVEDWYCGAFAAALCAICFFNAFGSPLANFFLATLLGFGTASPSWRFRKWPSQVRSAGTTLGKVALRVQAG